MNITRNPALSVENSLYIDHWTEEHNENDQLIDTYQGKLKMKNVKEQKYLGFIISEDGSNMNNIDAMGKKATGIMKQIQFLILIHY